MPEILEVETYRRDVDRTVGRRIDRVEVPDPDYLRNTSIGELQALLVGAVITATARRGKLLIVETSTATLGLRFGMTGRPVIDGEPSIEALEYSSARLDPAWERFRLLLDSGSLGINDPRRLGSVTIDPDLAKLGPDAWTVEAEVLGEILGRTGSAIKAALLDQAKVAGCGNLLVDELLWRSGIAPQRASNGLGPSELEVLGRKLPAMLDELAARGGSTEGDHMPARETGGSCPLDGSPMAHGTVGGRSTWWCPEHQR